MQKNLILTLVFSVIIAVFAVLNATPIPVNFIFAKVTVSAAVVILAAASLGAILVYFLELASKLRIKKANKTAMANYEEQLELFTVKEKSYIEEIEGLKNEVAVLEAHIDSMEKTDKTE